MTNRRQLHLNLLFNNAGNYSSAWRWPDSDPGAFVDIQPPFRTPTVTIGFLGFLLIIKALFYTNMGK